MKKIKTTIAQDIENNPLWKLILLYSIPAILSGLVGALYNIVDQIFIGQKLGIIGNSATNVAFPLITLTTSLALLFGVGATANFSISLGQKNIENAKKYVGVILTCIPFVSIIIMLATIVFTEDLLWFFGATNDNIAYATEYTKILAFGFPLTMMVIGATQLIRADGSPKYSMMCTISGAIANCFLNYLFMFIFDLGIKGAALATVLGQLLSFILVLKYFLNFKTFPLTKNMFKIKFITIKRSMSLGVAPAVNQFSITITQIVLNNSLTYYGALSSYGADIPLACAGIITKVNMIYIMIMVGIAQGTQPIIGYNYGAKQYDKVMECYKKCVKYGSIFSVMSFIAFQVFPEEITMLFGQGSQEYYEFSTKYFKTFLFMTFLNGIQPITGNFFTAIGKGINGSIIAFTKQILFLTPLILILPKFFGIDGILYAGPIADTLAFIVSMIFVTKQFKILKIMQKEKTHS